MPTPTKGPRLGGGPAHERLMLANLAAALFTHKSIKTTETKAKRLRPVAERLITFAKRGDLHARRRVLRTIGDTSVVHELFTEIAPLVADREGGYTRITKLGFRKGDNASMVQIELVLEPVSPRQSQRRRLPQRLPLQRPLRLLSKRPSKLRRPSLTLPQPTRPAHRQKQLLTKLLLLTKLRQRTLPTTPKASSAPHNEMTRRTPLTRAGFYCLTRARRIHNTTSSDKHTAQRPSGCPHDTHAAPVQRHRLARATE